MSRLNIFWVILLIYVISFFLIVSAEVQNTSYYDVEVEGMSYRGYLPLKLEDSLIYLGDFYSLDQNIYGYELITYNVTFNYQLPVFGYIKVQTDNGIVFNGYCHVIYFNATGIYIDDLSDDGLSVSEVEGIYITFFGYSNYEVTS